MSWLLKFESGKKIYAKRFIFTYIKGKILFGLEYWNDDYELVEEEIEIDLEEEKRFRKALADGYIELHETKPS